MRILGIDPGIALVGYGILDVEGSRLRCQEYGCITTEANTPLDERLLIIDRELGQIIEEFQPDEMAYEELFFYRNKKTAIKVAQARGVEVLAGARRQLPLYEYTPMQVKQAITGYGQAGKRQVQLSVKALLSLEDIPKPDDAADALAVAITHAFGQRFKEINRMK